MSFHVKDNFNAGGPISQVPASWFNKVGSFLNNLVNGVGIRMAKNDTGASIIELDTEMAANQLKLSKAIGGNPSDFKDSPSTISGDGASGTWTAGGENGLYLDCYCKIAPQTATSSYSVFQRARLTISKDGLIVKCELLGERTRIQAKNA